jgi:hypothetical protein
VFGMEGIGEKVGECLSRIEVVCPDCMSIQRVDDPVTHSVTTFPGHVMDVHPESPNAKGFTDLMDSLGPLKNMIGLVPNGS